MCPLYQGPIYQGPISTPCRCTYQTAAAQGRDRPNIFRVVPSTTTWCQLSGVEMNSCSCTHCASRRIDQIPALPSRGVICDETFAAVRFHKEMEIGTDSYSAQGRIHVDSCDRVRRTDDGRDLRARAGTDPERSRRNWSSGVRHSTPRTWIVFQSGVPAPHLT